MQRDLYYWHVVLLAMYENCNKMDRAISDLAAKEAQIPQQTTPGATW